MPDSFETGEVTARELKIAFWIGAVLFMVSLFLFMEFWSLESTITSSEGKVVFKEVEPDLKAHVQRIPATVIYSVSGREYQKKLGPGVRYEDGSNRITVYYYSAFPHFPWYGGRSNGILFVFTFLLMISGVLVILTIERDGPVTQRKFPDS